MSFFARLCRDHARAVVIVCILMTIPVAAGIFRIQVKTGQKDLIPTRYETSLTLKEVDELFGGTTYEIPLVTSDGLLTYPMIRKFLLLEDELDEAIGRESYVYMEHYLTGFALNAVNQAKRESGGFVRDINTLLTFGQALGNVPSPLDVSKTVPFEQALEEGLSLQLEDPVFQEWGMEKQGAVSLLSKDKKNAQVLIKINPDLSSSQERDVAVGIENLFHSYFEESDPPATVMVGGDPSIDKDLEDYVYRSSWLLALLAFVLLVGLLYIVFRRLTDIIFPLFIIAISTIWIYGLMGWFGLPYTVLSMALGPLVLGIDLGDLVYMITRFYEELGIRKDQRKSASRAITTVGVAIFLAAVCTVFAFASFGLSDFDILQEFGFMAAVGVGVCFLFSLTLLPALMVLREDFHQAKGTKAVPRGVSLFARDRKSRLDSFLTWVSEACQMHATAILIIFGFIILISVLGTTRLTATPDLRALAPRNIPSLEAQYQEEAVFGGQQQDVLLLTGDVLRPEVLVAMHDFQEELAKSPYYSADSTTSIGELIHDMIATGQVGGIKLLEGGEGDFAAAIPATEEGVEEVLDQMAAIMGPQEGKMISEDHRAALISIMGEGAKSNEEVQERDRLLNQAAADTFEPLGVEFEMGGITPLTKELLGNLVPTQIWTVILALCLSALVLVLIFRSLVYGLVTLSVLAVGVAAEMGFLVFMGWKLDMMTVLIASMVIGIGIDFGIHITYRYREELQRSEGRVEEALDHTIRLVGKPIVASAVAMAGAFGIIVFSRMQPIQRFGAITAVCLLVSMAASLFVIPSLLILIAHWRVRAAKRADAEEEELRPAEADGKA